MRKLIVGILIVVISGEWSAHADMRIWTDQKGNAIEAEFINVIGEKVVLRKGDGGMIQVPISGLCNADKKYLESNIPPKIEMDIRILKDNKNLGDGDGAKEEKVFCKIIITKKNKEPCNRMFTAHAYLFFKDTSKNTLIAKDVSKFNFEFSDENKVEFSTEPVITQHYKAEDDKSKSGEKYDGYLVFIKDAQGNLICVKGSSLTYEKNMGQIAEAQKGTRFDAKFAPIKVR